MDTQVLLIGAGPIGIEIAANLKKWNVPYIHIDGGCLGETISRWPRSTPFFSSPERVAIAGVPLQTMHQSMVTGEEYLAYLRSVVEIHDLDLNLYHKALDIRRRTDSTGGFEADVVHRGTVSTIRCASIILATGNMASARRLGIPGEDQDHVDHLYSDVHRYFKQDLLVVGGRNSAVEAAIRCWRAGARVTLMHRNGTLDEKRLNSRYHLEISILIKKEKIRFIGPAILSQIGMNEVTYIDPRENKAALKTDFVLICAGFDKDLHLLRSAGVSLDNDLRPVLNDRTMESSVKGLYLAGTATGGGYDTYKTFVGTSHVHVQKIIRDICAEDAVTGGYSKRVYPFSGKDIEPTEGSTT